MENLNGKEIFLQYVTVKIPGQKPRGSQTITTIHPSVNYQNIQESPSIIRDSSARLRETPSTSSASSVRGDQNNGDTPSVRGSITRSRSSTAKNNNEEDGNLLIHSTGSDHYFHTCRPYVSTFQNCAK